MDKAELESMVGGMTDDQLMELIKSAGVDKKPEAAQPVSYKLSDGTEVKAKDNEELARMLAAQLEEARRPQPKAVETHKPATQDLPKWDYKTFSEKFVEDPRAGLEYYETSNFGMPIGKTVPALVAAMTMLAQQVQQLQGEQFASAIPEYKTPETKRIIDQIIQERGWQSNRQSLEDAHAIAKSRGLVQEINKPKEKENNWTPPRTPRSGHEDQSSLGAEEVIRAANDMKLEDLQNLLLKQGFLKQGVI